MIGAGEGDSVVYRTNSVQTRGLPDALLHVIQVMYRLDLEGPKYDVPKEMSPGKCLWEKCQVQVQKCTE